MLSLSKSNKNSKDIKIVDINSDTENKIHCSVQMIILKVTMFLILLFCMQNILSIDADMKKSNLSYVHLERS